MEKKLVYHINRRNDNNYFKIGNILEVCPLTNIYPSRIISGEQMSYHGDLYLNLMDVFYESNGILNPNVSTLWEVFAELVRLKTYPNLISRFQTLFGFEDVVNLQNFIIQNRKKDDNILNRKVLTLEVTEYIQRDMNLLNAFCNSVEGNPSTYVNNQLIKRCDDYWADRRSDNPIIETLIINQCKIVNVEIASDFMLRI